MGMSSGAEQAQPEKLRALVVLPLVVALLVVIVGVRKHTTVPVVEVKHLKTEVGAQHMTCNHGQR